MSVDGAAKSVGSILDSLNSIEVRCKLAGASISGILLVTGMFSSLVLSQYGLSIFQLLSSMKVTISRARVMQEHGEPCFEQQEISGIISLPMKA